MEFRKAIHSNAIGLFSNKKSRNIHQQKTLIFNPNPNLTLTLYFIKLNLKIMVLMLSLKRIVPIFYNINCRTSRDY